MNILDTSVGASIQLYHNSVIQSARKLPTFLRSENVRKLTPVSYDVSVKTPGQEAVELLGSQ